MQKVLKKDHRHGLVQSIECLDRKLYGTASTCLVAESNPVDFRTDFVVAEYKRRLGHLSPEWKTLFRVPEGAEEFGAFLVYGPRVPRRIDEFVNAHGCGNDAAVWEIASIAVWDKVQRLLESALVPPLYPTMLRLTAIEFSFAQADLGEESVEAASALLGQVLEYLWQHYRDYFMSLTGYPAGSPGAEVVAQWFCQRDAETLMVGRIARQIYTKEGAETSQEFLGMCKQLVEARRHIRPER